MPMKCEVCKDSFGDVWTVTVFNKFDLCVACQEKVSEFIHTLKDISIRTRVHSIKNRGDK